MRIFNITILFVLSSLIVSINSALYTVVIGSVRYPGHYLHHGDPVGAVRPVTVSNPPLTTANRWRFDWDLAFAPGGTPFQSVGSPLNHFLTSVPNGAPTVALVAVPANRDNWMITANLTGSTYTYIISSPGQCLEDTNDFTVPGTGSALATPVLQKLCRNVREQQWNIYLAQ